MARQRGEVRMLYGVHACLALFRHRKSAIERVFLHEDRKPAFKELLAWCSRQRVPCKIASDDELTRVAATSHHEGVVCEAPAPAVLPFGQLVKTVKARTKVLIACLDGVENPHNLGAAMRTCVFFGVDMMVVASQQMQELSGAACRVAEGAAELLPVAFLKPGADMIGALRGAGCQTVATTPHTKTSLYEFVWSPKTAILFGAEGSGLDLGTIRAADAQIVIPRVGDTVESLNVASAVAVVLSHARARLKR
jgi:TrmH RNA methyltransferase